MSLLPRVPMPAPLGTKGFEARPPHCGELRPHALLLVEANSVAPPPAGLLATLTLDERRKVLALCQRRLLQRHEMLFEQGRPNEGIYLIETGLIRVYCVTRSGREITRAFWYPGNFVGGPEIFGRGRHVWSARAARKSEVFLLRGPDLRRLVARMPTLALNVIENLIFKAKCYSAQFQTLGTCSAQERLELMLDHLAEMHGVRTADGVSIGLTLTHADLAHLVGTTRQWITGALKRLEQRGMLTIRSTHLVWRRDHLRTAHRDV